jgi:hypothetical protein
MRKPAFIITIDTEGDNLWARRDTITTENAKFLFRFQALSEKYGLKPTYLTNWEMANSDVFQELARDAIRRGAGEVGMHLHAWNSPPLVPLTENDNRHHPYLIEYPEQQIREKVKCLTRTLEDIFQVKMRSHRAGRWAFNETYAQILGENGYHVDCSVTPGVSWRSHPGAPGGNGGTDYTHYPSTAYYMDLHQIRQSGRSALLQVPVTIIPARRFRYLKKYDRLIEKVAGERVKNRLLRNMWLRPDGKNGNDMLRILSIALAEKRDYVEFMLHSSELMPGGSPTFPSDKSIEGLYRDLEILFQLASRYFKGATLSEYYDQFSSDTLCDGDGDDDDFADRGRRFYWVSPDKEVVGRSFFRGWH